MQFYKKKELVSKNLITNKTNIKKTSNTTGFNYSPEMLVVISPRTREAVSKYPKGSFQRVNKTYLDPSTDKRYTIVY